MRASDFLNNPDRPDRRPPTLPGLRASDFLPDRRSDFLQKEDLRLHGDHHGVIATVGTAHYPKALPGQPKRKVLLTLTDRKRHALNKTNLEIVQQFLGDVCDAWLGQRIVFTYDPDVCFDGKPVGGIRVCFPHLTPPRLRR